MARTSPLEVIFAIFACILISGCGKNVPDQEKNSGGDTATATADTLKVAKDDSLAMYTFSPDSLPADVQAMGKIVLGAKWHDRAGWNYIVISEHKQGMMADPSWVSCIYGRKYTGLADTFSLRWEIKEYADCCSDAVHAQLGSLKITDLDKDGLAESIFGYRITPDGADAEKAKLMLHVKDQKYAVRGQFAGMEEDFGKLEKHEFDPAFKQIAPLFQDYAEQEWEAFQKSFYDSWERHDE